jgi:hypothetical protein
MALKLSNAAASAKADAIDTLLGAGAKFRILSGAAPANVDDAETGVLLAEFTLDNPAFGAAANGVMALAGVPKTVVAAATGTAGYFRARTSGGTAHVQGTVSASGGGGDAIINNVNIQSAADVTLNSWNYTQPKG